MRLRTLTTAVLALFALAVAAPPSRDVTGPKPAASEGGVDVYFSPGGGCTAAIVREIDGAKSSVKVQAYRLTSVPTVRALIGAHERASR